jgi:hypothetical protein
MTYARDELRAWVRDVHEEPDPSVSSVPRATFAYLGSLEWFAVRGNLCLVAEHGQGPPALGGAAVQVGRPVRDAA